MSDSLVNKLNQSANIEIDNYSIHKQLFKQIAPPTEEQLEPKMANVGGWFSSHYNCDYYMLMCKEISYYTVFHFNNYNYAKGVEELWRTLDYRGTIMDIIYNHGEDAYECWVQNPEGDVEMYYLFTYDWGVVEIEE